LRAQIPRQRSTELNIDQNRWLRQLLERRRWLPVPLL